MEIQTFNKLSKFEIITNKRIIDATINIIYDNLNVSLFGYKMIDANNCISTLDMLVKDHKNYMITPHIMGINCWMIIFEFENKYICACISKKDIKHYKKQIDYNTLKIYKFNIIFNDNLKKKLMPFSIFDGKFIIGNDNILSYNIFDIYYLGGSNRLTVLMKDKLIILKEIINDMNNMSNSIEFNIKLIGLYDLEQLADLTFNKIKHSKLKINGFIFIPILSGKTYIYINDNDFINLRQHLTEQQIPAITEYKFLNIPAIPLHLRVETQQDTDFKNTFVFKKTRLPDVFELYNYLPQYADKLYLNIFDKNKIGIAHIPNIETSQYCKELGDKLEIFKNKCVYNNKFSKWQPIKSN